MVSKLDFQIEMMTMIKIEKHALALILYFTQKIKIYIVNLLNIMILNIFLGEDIIIKILDWKFILIPINPFISILNMKKIGKLQLKI